MSNLLLDAPVALGAVAVAAAYDAGVGTDIGTASAAGTVIYKRCTGPCAFQLKFIAYQLSTALTVSGAVLTVAVRPVAGTGTVASGTRVIGTITVPVGIAGDVFWGVLSGDNTNINPGEEIIVEVTTKGGGTGSGFLCAGYSWNLVGPSSGGSATTAVTTVKPYGTTKTGSVKLVTSGATGQ